MPQGITETRQAQRRFEQHRAQRTDAHSPAARHAGPFGSGPLNIRNRQDCVVAWLLFSSALSNLRTPERAAPASRGERTATAARSVQRATGLRPHHAQPPPRAGYASGGVHAVSEFSYTAMAGSGGTARSLENIGNAVVTSCMGQPRYCGRAVGSGVVAAAGVLAAGGLGYLLGQHHAPACTPGAQTAGRTPTSSEALLALLPAEDRQQVWEIVRQCAGVPECAIPQIHTVLEQLPEPVQRELKQLLPAHEVPEARSAAWPPGAQAAVAPVEWMEHLSELFGTRISAEEAAFELDISAIAEATRASQETPGSIVQLRAAANLARMDVIADRFERDGRNVELRPFIFTARSLFGSPYTVSGRNLLVTLTGAGTPERTLMLVAHGDVAGAEIGSTGTLDNGAGVAALLAVARRLGNSLPDRTCVQFLVTDLEETGLFGAKRYVEECSAAGDCPDVGVNVDMLEGDGLVLSGSDEHVHYRDGDSRARGAEATPVTPEETQLRRLLEAAAAAVGVQVHAASGWSLQSDHIAFQRAGIPMLGFSVMDAADIAPERAIQQARDAFMRAEAAVNWDQYDAYLAGNLSAPAAAALEASMQAADDAVLVYQGLPESNRQRRIHTAADQPEQVDAPRALRAVRVLHRAVTAWLNTTPTTGRPLSS